MTTVADATAKTGPLPPVRAPATASLMRRLPPAEALRTRQHELQSTPAVGAPAMAKKVQPRARPLAPLGSSTSMSSIPQRQSRTGSPTKLATPAGPGHKAAAAAKQAATQSAPASVGASRASSGGKAVERRESANARPKGAERRDSADERPRGAERRGSADERGGGGGGGGGGGAGRSASPGLQLGKVLDEGAHAKVYEATYAGLGACAAKVIQKRSLAPAELAWVRDEVEIHRRLQHPHIVRLHAALEGPRTFTLVMSLCEGGSLRQLMDAVLGAGHSLGEHVSRLYFRQLIGALHYCHRHGVVHRDVKLDNLAFADGRRTTVMVLDLGYAAQSNELSGFVGSAHFAAPEVHKARLRPKSYSYVGTPTDVWSAGVVLFSMLATSLPFNGEEESPKLREKVLRGAWDKQPSGCSAEALDLLNGLLCVNPARRLTLDDVCEHPWVLGEDGAPSPSPPLSPGSTASGARADGGEAEAEGQPRADAAGGADGAPSQQRAAPRADAPAGSHHGGARATPEAAARAAPPPSPTVPARRRRASVIPWRGFNDVDE